MIPVVAATRTAIITAINGGSFAPITAATAAYDAYATLDAVAGANAGTGVLIVVPKAMSKHEWMSRGNPDGTAAGKQGKEIEFNVGIIYKIKTTPPNPTELDPYMNEAENIADFFVPGAAGNTLSIGGGFKASAIEDIKWEQLFDEQQLKESRVFAPVFAVKFRIQD